ncbi:MAG: hypothetical protein ABW213_01005 [Tardiphaga sp.]
MKKWILATAALAMLGHGSVIAGAQAQALSPGATPSSPAVRGTQQPSAAAIPEAPIGHRQPTRDAVPSESGRDNPANIDAADRKLDRMIKGICKGC